MNKPTEKKEGGLRVQGKFDKKSSSNLPLVSIITVVYNHKEAFKKTMENVVGQTYKNIEYVVIDGGSTDGTLDLIRQHEDKIAYWLSEPDKGIYDAMNKGIDSATGDYVWFMNAGDFINQPHTLEKVIDGRGKEGDIYYGETYMINETGEILGTRSNLTTRKLPEQLTVNSMGKGMVVCHQSFIASRKIVPYYNLNYPCSADIDWVITCLERSQKTIHTGRVLSRFLLGGFSGQNRKQCLVERLKIFIRHFGLLRALWYHIYILFRGLYYFIFNREVLKN